MKALLEVLRRWVETPPPRTPHADANPGLRQVEHTDCRGRWVPVRIPCDAVNQWGRPTCPTPHEGVECDRCGLRVDLMYRFDPRGEWTP